MYAIVKIGSDQFQVEKNDEILIDLLNSEAGKKLSYDTVTLLRDDKKIQVGQPYVKNAKVEIKVIDPLVAGKKLTVFKYKNKTNYKVKTGHRQKYTKVQVTAIKTATEKAETEA